MKNINRFRKSFSNGRSWKDYSPVNEQLLRLLTTAGIAEKKPSPNYWLQSLFR
jgi:hypothetical protein